MYILNVFSIVHSLSITRWQEVWKGGGVVDGPLADGPERNTVLLLNGSWRATLLLCSTNMELGCGTLPSFLRGLLSSMPAHVVVICISAGWLPHRLFSLCCLSVIFWKEA